MSARTKRAWAMRTTTNPTRPVAELGEFARSFGAREIVPDDAGEMRTRYVVNITESFADDLSAFRRQRAMADEAAHFDRVLRWLPRRIVPRYVNDEVIGDAIERRAVLIERGASQWELTLARLGVWLCVASEAVRYFVRAITGRKSS